MCSIKEILQHPHSIYGVYLKFISTRIYFVECSINSPALLKKKGEKKHNTQIENEWRRRSIWSENFLLKSMLIQTCVCFPL